MYTVVMMMTLSGAPADTGFLFHRCNGGCNGGYACSGASACHGVSACYGSSACHGGGGLFHRRACNGGCTGCFGGGCHGGGGLFHRRSNCCCAPVCAGCAGCAGYAGGVVGGPVYVGPMGGGPEKVGAPKGAVKMSKDVSDLINSDSEIKKAYDGIPTNAEKQKFVDGLQKTFDDAAKKLKKQEEEQSYNDATPLSPLYVTSRIVSRVLADPVAILTGRNVE